MSYLQSRGLTLPTVHRFGFGYAPDSKNMSDCLTHLRSHGFDEDDCVAAGIAKRSLDGLIAYDVFRGRVMIPIRNISGKVLGFAGRLLIQSDTAPKYVNCSSTSLFQKKEVLYGLDVAKDAESARMEYGVVILVEGYLDVAVLYEKGAGRIACVASMGTAVSKEQVKLALNLLADRIDGKLIINLDGDKAGYTAAERLCENVLPTMKDVACVHIAPPPEPFKDLGEYLEVEDNTVLDYLRHLESVAKPWIEWRASRLFRPLLESRKHARIEADVERAAEMGARVDVDDYFKPEVEMKTAGSSFTERQSEILRMANQKLLEGMSGASVQNLDAAEEELTIEQAQSAANSDEIAACPTALLDQLSSFVCKALRVSPGTNVPWLVHCWANDLCDGQTRRIPVLYDAIMARIDRDSASWEDTCPEYMIDFMPPPSWVIEELPRKSRSRVRHSIGVDERGGTIGAADHMGDNKRAQESRVRKAFDEKVVLPRIEQSRSIVAKNMSSNPRAAAEEIILRSLIWADEYKRIEALDELLQIMIRLEESNLSPFWTSRSRNALFEYLLAVTGNKTAEEMAAECEKELWWNTEIELLFFPLDDFGDEELQEVREVERLHPVLCVQQGAYAVEQMSKKVAAARAADRIPEFIQSRLGHLTDDMNEDDAEAHAQLVDAISGIHFFSPQEREEYRLRQLAILKDASDEQEKLNILTLESRDESADQAENAVVDEGQ